MMRSDGEPALKSLLENAIAATPGLEATHRNSPPGDPAANGLAERAVAEVKAHCRVLVADLQTRYPLLTAASPLLAWVARHAANCISRYRTLDDGRTAHWRITGRRFARSVTRFGEVVNFVATGPRKGQGSSIGIFVGIHERTGCHLLLTPEGVKTGRRVIQRPSEQQWDWEIAKGVRGLP